MRLTTLERLLRRLLVATAVLGALAWYGGLWFGMHAFHLPFAIAVVLLLGGVAWWRRRVARAAEAERAARLERELWRSTLPGEAGAGPLPTGPDA